MDPSQGKIGGRTTGEKLAKKAEYIIEIFVVVVVRI